MGPTRPEQVLVEVPRAADMAMNALDLPGTDGRTHEASAVSSAALRALSWVICGAVREVVSGWFGRRAYDRAIDCIHGVAPTVANGFVCPVGAAP